MNMGRYIGTHMHIHSTFEQFASMRSQAARACSLGLKAIFITDHDTRMGYLQKRVNEFAFQGNTSWQEDAGGFSGWRTPEEETLETVLTERGWSLSVAPGVEAVFFSTGKRHQASLLAELVLRMRVVLPDEWTGGLRIDIGMSHRPDNYRQQHLYYEMGKCEGGDPTAWRKRIPAEYGACEIILPLSADAEFFDPFGKDNCFSSITLSTFGGLTVLYEGHDMTREFAAEAVRVRQQALADRIGAEMGIAIHVATEISAAGVHKLSFSRQVPVLDYPAHDYQISWQEAAEHVLSRGGVMAYNHMFETWKRVPLDDQGREETVKSLVEHLTEVRAEGAQLIEVGFPMGRSGFTVEAHLRVWDELGRRGLLLSGYGDNDSHGSYEEGWLRGNNFAAYWSAEDTSRGALERAMLSGDGYTADPIRFCGEWQFELSGAPMGSVYVGGREAQAKICVRRLQEPVELRLLAGGQAIDTRVLEAGCAEVGVPVRREEDIVPVRAELRTMDGRLLLAGNPVYWTEKDIPGYPERKRIWAE